MTTYTYSQARQNFAYILSKAQEEGEVLIKRRDGSIFILRPYSTDSSPLDVDGVSTDITLDEILDTIQEVRKR